MPSISTAEHSDSGANKSKLYLKRVTVIPNTDGKWKYNHFNIPILLHNLIYCPIYFSDITFHRAKRSNSKNIILIKYIDKLD